MKKYVESLNESMFKLFKDNPNVYLIGEDILDPYGGAFKVSRGMSTAFPDRILSTPISEAAICGLAAGMALRGLHPIVEIMFGDFLTLCTDQIINHMTKFRGMYNGQVSCPVVIRTAMGGRRGYGPTHSQTLEKMFLGIPHLNILAPSHFHDPGNILQKAVLESLKPTLFIENKILYPTHIKLKSDHLLSIDHLKGENFLEETAIVKNGFYGDPDAILICYGGLSKLLEEFLISMEEEEISLVAIFPSCISDPPIELFSEWANVTNKVILIDDAPGPFNWISEISTQLYERHRNPANLKIKKVQPHPTVIPSELVLELQVLPGIKDIEDALMEVLLG